MKTISIEDIYALKISNEDIFNWVKKAFLSKTESMLPPKISQVFNESKNFYNTMPAIVPEINAAGVKIVSRYVGRHPAIMGEILLYDFKSGELLALMDATWITAKRTGAVAALAVETFAKKDFNSIGIIGLGQAGLSFLDMFLINQQNKDKKFKLKYYKDQAYVAKEYLTKKGVKNIEICNTNKDLIRDTDVIISAITVAEEQLGKDEWFKKGCLVVPIHTKGFQNCDLFFDKVFADDKAHVEDFKYFNQFKSFEEISPVLLGKAKGRENDQERILSYNIGIALHDVYCAKMIFNMVG